MLPDMSEPRIHIEEQPKSRGFRFRYTCEGPSHGGIPGAGSDKNKKTFPCVKIVNYQGYARIVVQLVTSEDNPRLHPHSLVGKECQNGICTVQCGPKDMSATFPNLGIQHVTKKNVAKILEERYIAAETQLNSINDGISQQIQKNIKEEERKKIAEKVQSDAKSIDLSVVRLMFIAYLPDSSGAYTVMLKPVISAPIYDSKSPSAATLKICRMNCNAASVCGGDEVFLLCDKVQRDDIQVRFFEEDAEGNEVWEGRGTFGPTDVHRQYAIVFQTPPYKDRNITMPVIVNVQLQRKSDQEVSEARPFTYLPEQTDIDQIGRKRRRGMPDFVQHVAGSNPGYKFASGGAGMTQNEYRFQGSPNSINGGKMKEARPPPIKQEDPQKGPMDPSILLMMNNIKQEPNSPASQQFGSRHSSYQGSSSQASSSSMSEGGSPQAPSPPSEPEFMPGTQIPRPRAVKKYGGLPSINFSPQVNAGTNAQFQMQQQQQQQQQQHQQLQQQQQQQLQMAALPPQQLYYQQQQTNNVYANQSPERCFDSQSPMSQPQLTPEDVIAAVSPMSDAGIQIPQDAANFVDMATVQVDMTTGQIDMTTVQVDMATVQVDNQAQQYFNDQSYGQNAFGTINENDILTQAVTQTVTQAVSGPGSGSLGVSSYFDPLMTPSLSRQTDLTMLTQNFTLGEINPWDLFDDIESDAVGGLKSEVGRCPIGDDDSDDDSIDYAQGYGFDEDDVSDPEEAIKPSAVPTTVASSQLRRVKADDIESDAAMDASIDVTSRLSNLSLTGAAPTKTSLTQHKAREPKIVSRSPERKPVEQHEGTHRIDKEKSVPTPTSAKKESDLLNFMESYIVEWSKKTSRAIQDYSVTGDPRMLLVLSRRLTSVIDDNGDTAIQIAVIHDQVGVLSELLDVVVTLDNCQEILDSRNKNKQTALHIAALADNVEAVISLLKAGADPLIVDKNGNHSIHIASRHGNPDILRRILSSKRIKGRQFDTKNYKGMGCYHLAARAKSDSSQCMRLLKLYNFNVDMPEDTFRRTALHIAIENKNLVAVGCLLAECDADVEATTYDGYTPLHIAAATDSHEVASLLLACGADREAKSFTPSSKDEFPAKPIDLTRSQKVRDILSGDSSVIDVSLPSEFSTVDDDLCCLDPISRKQLCNLLNLAETGSNWLELADCLQLSTLKTTLKSSDNPTDRLLLEYMVHGSANGLRSALMHIGRHDALQVLNRALNKQPQFQMPEPVLKPRFDCEDLDRYDSAIGSMPGLESV